MEDAGGKEGWQALEVKEKEREMGRTPIVICCGCPLAIQGTTMVIGIGEGNMLANSSSDSCFFSCAKRTER